MSNRLLGLAWKHAPAGLGSPARMLYAWFCDRAIEEDGDTTWASIPDMIEAMDLSRSNTCKALAKLQAQKLVKPLTAPRAHGRTRYQVLAPPHVSKSGHDSALMSRNQDMTTPPHVLKSGHLMSRNQDMSTYSPILVPKRENARANGAAPATVASAALSQRGLYETFVRVLGREPQRGKEHGRWQYGCQELHRDGVSPPEIPRLVDAYRAKFGAEIPCHPGTIHDHLPALRGGTHGNVTQRPASADLRAAAAATLRLETLKARHAAGRPLPPAAYAELAAAGIIATPPDPAD